MTVPLISKHAREIGTSPTVAGLVGMQLVLHSETCIYLLILLGHFISHWLVMFVAYFVSTFCLVCLSYDA